MGSLILKDLIFNKKFILLIGIPYSIYIGWLGSKVVSLREFTAVGAFIICIVPLLCYAREDKFKGSVLSSSLPVTRKDIVLSKYATSWLLMIVFYLLSTAVALVFPGSKLSLQGVLNIKMILIYLLLLTLFISILLPLLIWFGMVGSFVFLISLQVLGIITLWLGSTKLTKVSLKGLIAGIGSFFAALNSHLGVVGYQIFLLGIILLLNFVSFKCSEFIFKRKEL